MNCLYIYEISVIGIGTLFCYESHSFQLAYDFAPGFNNRITMSTKCAKKKFTAAKTTNFIVNKKKSTQNGRQIRSQLRAKNKKTVKPVTVKQTAAPKTKSTNTSNDTCDKDTPLQTKVRQLVQQVEQVEYYPDKLKRDVCAKKTFLKPKHNFKLIASTNKRKMAVPQKGGNYIGFDSEPQLQKQCKKNTNISSTNCQYSEMSMVDMVKVIEDTHILSDEDFMEILTCPSPVWWEDPPDEGYFEDAICTRPPSPPSKICKFSDAICTRPPSPPSKICKKKIKTTRIKEQKNNRVSTPNTTCIDFETEIEFKIISRKMVEKKKQKLESLLRNMGTNKQNVSTVNDTENLDTRCKDGGNTGENNDKIITGKGEIKILPNNTDEEELSDLSFNEEDVLSNLENMDIPIEQSKEQVITRTKIVIDIPGTETIKNINTDNEINSRYAKITNELVVPDVLPPLKRKPDLKIVNKTKSDSTDSTDSTLDYNLDIVAHSNFRFISDDEFNIVESSSNTNTAKKMKIVDISSSIGESSSNIDVDTSDTNYGLNKEQIDDSSITDGSDKNSDFLPKKVVNDLSEYITVYKIMSHDTEDKDLSNEILSKSPESSNNSKLDNVRGKLNNFFKTCKSNKRLKKTDISFPSISVEDIKELKNKIDIIDSQGSAGNEENRLKCCDYCVLETEKGTKGFSCERCQQAPVFACDLCNFLADTKELNCKDVDRIPWENRVIVSQT